MTYTSGMLNKRIKVAKLAAGVTEDFGKSGQPKYEWVNPNGDHAFWGGEKFDRGTKSMREGALDAYNVKMFRFRYHKGMNEWCLLQYQGRWYQILSYNDEYQENIIQITAKSLANQKVNIVEYPSDSTITGGDSTTQPVGE